MRIRQPAALMSLAAIVCWSMSQPAIATTATTTFTVTATATKACNISATSLNFGNYDPTAATPLDSTSTITILCTTGTAYNIGLNAGSAPGATVTTRKMTNGANSLNYALYQDSSRTINWGNTVGTDTVGGTAGGTAANLSVYGQVPALQNVPVGAYTDTVTATITY